MRTPSVLALILLAGLTGTVHAQQPKAAAPPGPPLPAPPPNFQYSPDGRRDPFVDLVHRGTDTVRGNNPSVKRPEGVPGLETNAIVVLGIMLHRGAFLAMVAGPDGKVFTVRAGDKLFDGVIRTITTQAVVILQEVNDPLSLEKQREVRKFLRGREEVK